MTLTEVELVDEVPRRATCVELGQAFTLGAVASGVVCALAGLTVGFLLGVVSKQEPARVDA